MEDYDWGLTPEKIESVKQDMTVSVSFEVTPDVAAVLAARLKEVE